MVYSIVPLLSMLSAGLARRGTFPQGLSWPTNPQWHNFVDAWTAANMTVLLKSSVLIVLGVVPASILLATMAAYAVVTLRIPFGVFVVVLLLTLPFELVVIPLYCEINDLGIPHNQLVLILPLIGLNMPVGVFWMRTHFLGVPRDLSEAASIDGAGPLAALFRVHMPLATPAIAALATILFLTTWNSFLLPLVLIADPAQRTMAGALQAFVSQYGSDQVLLNAGALLLMAPTILLLLALQRYFVRALLQGAVKG